MIRDLAKNAGGKFPSAPDITLGRRKLKAELIPPALIGARFFAVEPTAVEELDEEHGGEDWLRFEAKTDNGS